MEEPAEHGTTRLAVAHVLHNDSLLRAVAWEGMNENDRQKVNVVFANVGKALAAYERKLVSRRSPFDIFVEGLSDGDTDKLKSLDESA